MSEITRVGADLAKNVIQIHAVDALGKVVSNRPPARDKFMAWCAELPAGCLIAMEASASTHHWARKLSPMGLDARIIAAHLVAPYRLQGKGGKNDANDAAVICEAASRPQMHFVPIKTIDQQSMLCIHRLREGFKEESTACVNRIRGLLAEFGVVIAQKTTNLRQAQQLAGVGSVTASAVVATVGDFKQFRNGSQFGAWLGLTPRQNSSGGKNNLGKITKRGDISLRMLLIQGAK